MIRTFEFVPNDFDYDDYAESYPDFHDDADYLYEAYVEDCSYELRAARESADEAFALASDPATGQDPIFHDVSIETMEPYPYGRYPNGAVVVEIDCPDDFDDVDTKWQYEMSGSWHQPDPESKGYRHRALARYNAEARRVAAMIDALEDAGFVEDVYHRKDAKLPLNAGTVWPMDRELAFQQPSEWPSRNGKPKGKTAKQKHRFSFGRGRR